MIRKIIKKSSKRVFLLYAVIWGLFSPVFTGLSHASVEKTPVDIVEKTSPGAEEVIRSLDDPFDVQVRAPEIVTLFLDGLAEIKRQMAIKEAPPEEKVAEPVAPPVVAPVVVPIKEPVKPKKLDIPEMKVTGIIYGTDRPQAIINGEVVSVGSTIDGASIINIQKGRIDVRFEGSDITLKFNNE
jgi:hypothetical protein